MQTQDSKDQRIYSNGLLTMNVQNTCLSSLHTRVQCLIAGFCLIDRSLRYGLTGISDVSRPDGLPIGAPQAPVPMVALRKLT